MNTLPDGSDAPDARDTVLVTGVAGFIGFHLARRLLADGHAVVGIDTVDAYYDPALKEARLALLVPEAGFSFHRARVEDADAVERIFAAHHPRRVVHLAAQAGVRHSLAHPRPYVTSNVAGFLEILEACRHHDVAHLVYASSSSVYGANTTLPLSEHAAVDHPLNLYAATKRANELMAHAYSHLYGIPTTGVRFFTVYGPWGRPDMAMFLFTRAILAGEPIQLFSGGRMRRDFTYVDDVVESLVRLLGKPPARDSTWNAAVPDPSRSNAPFAIYNVGNSAPCDLAAYIAALEAELGRPAHTVLAPAQPAEVTDTWADTRDLEALVGFRPHTPIREGIARFVAWYRGYYGV